MKGVPKKLIESDKHVRNVKYIYFFFLQKAHYQFSSLFLNNI